MRVIRESLKRLGLDEGLMRHGIVREIFAMPLADSWREYLRGETTDSMIARPSVSCISDACRERWIVPRARRQLEYQHWSQRDIDELFEELSPDTDSGQLNA